MEGNRQLTCSRVATPILDSSSIDVRMDSLVLTLVVEEGGELMHVQLGVNIRKVEGGSFCGGGRVSMDGPVLENGLGEAQKSQLMVETSQGSHVG